MVHFTEANVRNATVWVLKGMRVSVSGPAVTSPSTLSKSDGIWCSRDHCGSDSSGTVVDESGFTKRNWHVIQIKASRDGRAGIMRKNLVWSISKANSRGLYRLISPCLAPPRMNWMSTPRISLSAYGVKAVAEGANMPTTIEMDHSSRQAYDLHRVSG
ncbi:hypothetical protein ACVXHB_28135 [Escherichia coli]